MVCVNEREWSVEMSFLEFWIIRPAPRVPLNYPPLSTGTGRFSATRDYPRSKIFVNAQNKWISIKTAKCAECRYATKESSELSSRVFLFVSCSLLWWVLGISKGQVCHLVWVKILIPMLFHGFQNITLIVHAKKSSVRDRFVCQTHMLQVSQTQG